MLTCLIGLASAGSPVALPTRILLSDRGVRPIAVATAWPEGRPSCTERRRFRWASTSGPSPAAGSGSWLSGKTSELSILYDAWGWPIERGVGPIWKKKLQSIPKFDGAGWKPPRSWVGSPVSEKTGRRFTTVVLIRY